MTKQKRQKHTKEYKEEAVKLITSQGYSVAEAARNLGVNATMLGRRKKESEHFEDESTATGNSALLQAELKLLRKENKYHKMNIGTEYQKNSKAVVSPRGVPEYISETLCIAPSTLVCASIITASLSV